MVVVDELSRILNQADAVTKKPEKYLSLQEDEAEKIKKLTKDLYNFSKTKENPKLKTQDALKKLVIADLDEEQIWQQIELQNNSISNSLVNEVAHLLAKKNQLKFPLKVEKEELEEDDDDEENEDEDDCNDASTNLQESGEEEEDEEDKKTKKSKTIPVKSSIVDDKFFKLHEMEKFLEKMEKRENAENDGGDDEDDDEEINYFEDSSSDANDDSENQLHYNDFFDQPEDETSVKSKKRKSESNAEGQKKKVRFSEENIEDEEVEDGSSCEEEDDFGNFEEEEENEDEDEDKESDEGNEYQDENDLDDTEDKNSNSVKQPSSFEERQERLKSRIKSLEEEALKEKPWQLKGEITASSRPQNSLLQEYVEFDIATRPAPVFTEKTTLKLEDIIIQRIKDKAWDDVVRKIKPVESEIEYKKRLVLDQEKSKLSLAEIYEKEYLNKLDSKNEDLADKPEIEPPEHQEIRNMMKNLFSKLDALSNFHFTPKQVNPEIKIISNLPAINMEEVAPVATSDATLLAPEEVKAKPKGELIGKSERTSTDKKRERRKKKLKQKLKYEKIEAKVKNKLEENSKTSKNKLSQKLLQKITKSSNVTQLDHSHGGKYIKSSNAFFSKLQDETSSKIKKKGFEMKKPKVGKKLKKTKVK